MRRAWRCCPTAHPYYDASFPSAAIAATRALSSECAYRAVTGEAVVRMPDDAMVDEMIADAKPYLRLVILLAVDAGLRAGEVRGLRWIDVDLARGALCVRETVYFGERDTPKSGTSGRSRSRRG